MAKTTNKPAKGDAPKYTQEKLSQLRQELIDAKRSLAANELPNPRVITSTRREIARALTALNANKKEEAKDA